MTNDNKRIIVCIPNQPNISGLMPLKYAKSLAEEKCPDSNVIISIIVMDNNNDFVTCFERNNGTWTEKEIMKTICFKA